MNFVGIYTEQNSLTEQLIYPSPSDSTCIVQMGGHNYLPSSSARNIPSNISNLPPPSFPIATSSVGGSVTSQKSTCDEFSLQNGRTKYNNDEKLVSIGSSDCSQVLPIAESKYFCWGCGFQIKDRYAYCAFISQLKLLDTGILTIFFNSSDIC